MITGHNIPPPSSPPSTPLPPPPSSSHLGPKNRTIVLTSSQEGPLCTMRLERLVPGRHPGEVEHISRTGIFNNVMVLKKKTLESVCKPHVVTSFDAYVVDTNMSGRFLERPRRKERRDLRFWFYRGLGNKEKVSVCSEYVKLLLEPETFPSDMLGYIKKNILLMKYFERIKRLQLETTQESEPEEDQGPEIPLIENFITVLTPAMYDYQYLPEVPVSKKTMVRFRLRAAADAHVALSYVYGDTDRRTYEIVLGGWNNRRSAIRYGGRGEIQVETLTPNILNGKELRDFWISWDDNSIRVGRGLEGVQDCFLEWRDIPAKKHHSINLMSVSTGPGSEGRWEFVEYIVPYEVIKETKGERRHKVLRGLVWYAKKTKIIARLEEAFPCALNMPDLLRLSTVSLSNMLEAVVFLKKTQRDGNVIELSKGVWMRSHAHPADRNHELKKVIQLPRFSPHDAPTIAIVTSTYMEKVAVDIMFDSKASFLLEGTSKQDKFSNSLYTVGKMCNKNVVAMKLEHFNSEVGGLERHTQSVAVLLSHFDRVRQVLIVGVGGAVPDYHNFESHCRRGDVVISGPRPSDGSMYVFCPGVDDEPEVDPSGHSAFYPTSCWNSDDATGTLQKHIHSLLGLSRSRYSEQFKPWEKFINDGQELIGKADERFYRPAQKTDRLQAQIDRSQEPITVFHPTTSLDMMHLRKENQPVLRRGAIASGNTVAKDLVYRRLFAGQNQVLAFDCGLNKAVEALMSTVGGENMAIILGMSDYSDGTIGKSWQPYAALASAACAKSLIALL